MFPLLQPACPSTNAALCAINPTFVQKQWIYTGTPFDRVEGAYPASSGSTVAFQIALQISAPGVPLELSFDEDFVVTWVKNLTSDELFRVPGIPKNVSQSLYGMSDDGFVFLLTSLECEGFVLINTRTQEQHQFLTNLGSCLGLGQPRISPSGRYVSFSEGSTGLLPDAFYPDGLQGRYCYLYDFLLNKTSVITPNTTEFWQYELSYPRFSPSGSQIILYARYQLFIYNMCVNATCFPLVSLTYPTLEQAIGTA